MNDIEQLHRRISLLEQKLEYQTDQNNARQAINIQKIHQLQTEIEKINFKLAQREKRINYIINNIKEF